MQERAIKTREKILETAIRSFAGKGFHGTRIDDIANAAEVNKQRIYVYFGNKEKLFEAAVAKVFERANAEDAVLVELTSADLPELTEKLLRHYLEVHRRHPELHRMVGWVNLELSDSPSWLRNVKESGFRHLRELYRQGQDTAVFPSSVSFDVYIFTLLALTYFHAANRLTASQTISGELFTPDGAERLVREFAVLAANHKSHRSNIYLR